MRTFALKLYRRLLYWLDLAERRCMTCGKLLGYKRGIRPRALGIVTHGLCPRCEVVFQAEAEAAVLKMKRSRRPRRQLSLRKTLRRRTGGWSGAVALCGRVS